MINELEVGTTIVRFEMEKHKVLEIGKNNIVLMFGKNKQVYVNAKKIAIGNHPTMRNKCVCYMAKWLYQKVGLPMYVKDGAQESLLIGKSEASELEELFINQ